jgi:hypothetical protein
MRVRLTSFPSLPAVPMPRRVTLRWKLASLLIFIAVLLVALTMVSLASLAKVSNGGRHNFTHVTQSLAALGTARALVSENAALADRHILEETLETKRPPSAIILLSDGKTTVPPDPVPIARTAGKLKIPIYTVALGTRDATVPNPNPFGTPLLVAPDPATLREIARVSGGKAFTAEDSDSLKSIYKTLGSQLGTKEQKRQITASFAIGGLVLLLGAAGASLRFAGRLP